MVASLKPQIVKRLSRLNGYYWYGIGSEKTIVYVTGAMLIKYPSLPVPHFTCNLKYLEKGTGRTYNSVKNMELSSIEAFHRRFKFLGNSEMTKVLFLA